MIFSTIFPAIIAASVFLSCSPGKDGRGERLIFSAVAMLLSYIFLSWLVVWSQRLGISTLQIKKYLSISAVFLIFFITVRLVKSRRETVISHNSLGFKHNLSRVFAAYLVLALGALLYLLALFPAAGWDSLQHWLSESVKLLGMFGEHRSGALSVRYIHPATGVGFAAWSASHSQILPQSITAIQMGFASTAVLTLAVIGFCSFIKCRLDATTIVLCIALTLPLGVNHILGYGYVDLWIATNGLVVTCATYLLAVEPSRSRLVAALLAALMLCVWRNDSVIYVVPHLLAIFAWFIFQIRSRTARAGLISLALSLLILASGGYLFLDLSSEGLGRFGVGERGGADGLWVGFRFILLEPQPILDVIRALIRALFANASFATLGLLWIFSSGWVLSNWKKNEINVILVITPACLAMIFLCALYWSPLFFENYGRIDYDTGLSRFMLSWALASMPVLAVAFNGALEDTRPKRLM